ncbi:flagellar biosynthesis protein, FliO [Shewanella sediminis HAW-EB3]|uniref:Flagellar protein n=1 Tax=Shewanella sediminis (strain HAW-EB3) TaxID=425104 RepID=A8FXT8_SHESH|nr:flagellar biosynthetic protein FliO [Shewanella sediminis]ABV37661.1 flagellar biosynthesis protein, FliO [Shewanella sediminis HAW-EB3]
MIISMLAAGAATTTAAASAVEKDSAMATLANMLGGLIVVLILIFVLAYIVRRFNLVPASSNVLKVVAATSLGQREKVVLVEVDGQQYLLGVTPQQVNLIDKLETVVNTEMDSFASRLLQAKSKQS